MAGIRSGPIPALSRLTSCAHGNLPRSFFGTDSPGSHFGLAPPDHPPPAQQHEDHHHAPPSPPHPPHPVTAAAGDDLVTRLPTVEHHITSPARPSRPPPPRYRVGLAMGADEDYIGGVSTA